MSLGVQVNFLSSPHSNRHKDCLCICCCDFWKVYIRLFTFSFQGFRKRAVFVDSVSKSTEWENLEYWRKVKEFRIQSSLPGNPVSRYQADFPRCFIGSIKSNFLSSFYVHSQIWYSSSSPQSIINVSVSFCRLLWEVPGSQLQQATGKLHAGHQPNWDLRPETWDLRPRTRDPRPEAQAWRVALGAASCTCV